MKPMQLLLGMIVTVVGLGITGAEELTHADVPILVTQVKSLEKPLVQIAILLDTSGSMSGLINQARAQLWSIVNEFIFAKRLDVSAPSKANVNKLANPARVTANHRHGTEPCV